MAATSVSRAFLLLASNKKSNHLPRFFSKRLIARAAASNNSNTIIPFPFPSSSSLLHDPTPLTPPTPPTPRLLMPRFFSSSEPNTTKINTKVNFSLPSDDEDDDDNEKTTATKEVDKSKLPPPYDPFNKKPAIEDPEDPKDLQEVFHKMRTDGLQNNAVKMFDALSKDGLTHEALELFAQIKDKGHMPDVIAHTAVVEAYANAGKTKDALKVYLRMLASGVSPNAYTYSVLIKALAADPNFLEDAKKYVMEMMGKGLRPNAGTYTAVFEGFAIADKAEEGKEFLKEMKAKGFVADEKAVREELKSRRGLLVTSVINILFGK